MSTFDAGEALSVGLSCLRNEVRIHPPLPFPTKSCYLLTSKMNTLLTRTLEKYDIYELIENPSGIAVYRDPFCSLNRTVKLLSDYPAVASKIRRMWFNGFYVSETDQQIFRALRSCANLTSVSLPWTTLRHLGAKEWGQLLLCNGAPLRSLELLAVDLTAAQVKDPKNQADMHPLASGCVDFSRLRKLKIFGDSTFMPINDQDLQAISRTATRLEEFHVTCHSTISIDGRFRVTHFI